VSSEAHPLSEALRETEQKERDREPRPSDTEVLYPCGAISTLAREAQKRPRVRTVDLTLIQALSAMVNMRNQSKKDDQRYVLQVRERRKAEVCRLCNWGAG
jgi:hypothetical protein